MSWPTRAFEVKSCTPSRLRLRASSQDEPLPPVVSFAMGTLGFLTPFESTDAGDTLERVLAADHTPVFCTLRTRRRCEVVWCASSFSRVVAGPRARAAPLGS